MARKPTSFRLKEDSLDKMDALVEYKQKQMNESLDLGLDITLNRTTLIELMIRDWHKKMTEEQAQDASPQSKQA